MLYAAMRVTDASFPASTKHGEVHAALVVRQWLEQGSMSLVERANYYRNAGAGPTLRGTLSTVTPCREI